MKLDLRKYNKAALAFVMLVFLHSLLYFDYVNINYTVHGWTGNILSLSLIAICLLSKGPRRIPGQYWFLGLLLVPVLSFLPAWLENGQSPVASARAYLSTCIVLVYFILHKAKVQPGDLVKGITAFALVRLAILVIQQFTYPDYLFSFRPEGFNTTGTFRGIEVRSGIYRFYIEDTYLSMFLVFYYLQRLLRGGGLSDMLLCLAGVGGVYLDQSRQFMFSTVVAVGFILFFSSKIKHKGWIIAAFAVAGAIVAANVGEWFEDLIYMTQDDLSSDNIRLLSYTTFGLEFWGGPLSVIFGNGPVGASAYGEQVMYMRENLRLFHADVGLVGAASLYGVVTVLFFLSFFIFFVFRNWSKMQMHLKMYYVAMLVNAPLVTIYTQNTNWFVFMGFMLFLTDRDIVRYERRLALRKQQANVVDVAQ